MNSGNVLRTLLVCGLYLAYALPASAQVYGRAVLGWSGSTSADIKDRDFAISSAICGDPNCNTPDKIKDVGSSAILGIGTGWNLDKNFRAEAMLNYRGWYSTDKTLPYGAQFNGDVKSWNLMLNGYYDFDASSFRPFVGLGVGLTRNKLSNVKLTLLSGGGEL